MEVKPGARGLEKCPFPLSRGVPSLEVTNTKILGPFIRGKIRRELAV